jgi:Copper amine oxidase, enzyme domain
MKRRPFVTLLLVAAAWLAAAASVRAAAFCQSGEHQMSWPDANPVWTFCWLRPSNSSGGNGSGLEIRDVHYKGHLVMNRGHAPILNVQYDPGGCGCYRDWSYQEAVFQADHVISPGYAEPTTPPLTVCDTGGSGGDIGTFTGVAAEKLPDRLILTTQYKAGFYRYTMKWRFYLDGRIEPVFAFGALNSGCIGYTHRHHAYWRFDFDIDSGDSSVVSESMRPAIGPKPGAHVPPTILPNETMRINDPPGLTWSIVNPATGRGYRVVPGPEVALPADSFSVGDAWFLKYKFNELDDTGQPGTGCPINIGNLVNGEPIAGDVVMWYRSGWLHLGQELDDCDLVGPTLHPIGDWSP